MQMDVTLADGSEETLSLLEYVPTRVGIETRKKLDVRASGQGSTVEFEIDNPNEKGENAKLYLVNTMLDKSGCSVDADDLSYNSFNAIAGHYWSQIQGEQAKN